MTYRYKAFISYRHATPDQEIAKKLHTMIETFSVPASLKKTLGISRIGRVFRDEEELPLSANLGEDIRKALDESEWLICICSPRYLESKWCMEELSYFIASGRRDHVLAILTEGEPAESFPELLRFEKVDGKIIENEPLAADVRSADLNEALHKLKNEKLRIIAPMLSVSYDDLKQRARQRRIRIILASALSVILLLSAFLIYALQKNKEISDERNEALLAESRWLSKAAQEAMDDNDRMLALMLYLEALPKNIDDPERPISEDAANGLISAVIGSNAIDSYSGITGLDLPSDSDSRIIDVKAVGSELFLTRFNGIEVYDLDTGNYLGKLDAQEDRIIGSFIRSRKDYYVYHMDYYEEHFSYKEPYIATYEDSYEYDGPMEHDSGSFCGLYAMTYYTGNAIKIVYGDRNYFHAENQSRKVPDRRFESAINDVTLTNEEFLVTLIDSYSTHFNQTEYEHIYLIDIYNEIVNTYPYSIGSAEYYGNVSQTIASSDGKVIYGMAPHYLYLWNRESAELFRTVSIDRFDNTAFERIKAPSQSDLTYIAVMTQGGNVFLYDFVSDEVLLKLDNQFYDLHSIMFNYDGSRLLCAADRNKAIIFSCEDGRQIEELDAGFHVSNAEYGRQDYNGNAESDNYILLYKGNYGFGNSSYISEVFIYSTNSDTESQKYKTTLPVPGFSDACFSSGNRKLWLANCGTVNINPPLCIYDAESGNLLKTIDDYTSNIYQFRNFILSMPDSTDISFTDLENKYIRIYDEENMEEIISLYPTYPHVYGGQNNKYTADNSMECDVPLFSDDGRYMFLRWDHSEGINYSEAFVFVYDTQSWEELWHIGIYDPYDRENNSVMEETDSFYGDLFVYAYPAGNDKVLVQYSYVETKYDPSYSYDNGLAFELRDAKTGEVLEKYIPEGTYKFVYSEDDRLILLYSDEEHFKEKSPDHAFRTDSFKDLADTYVYEEITDPGTDIDLNGTIVIQNEDLMLLKGKDGSYSILRIPSLEDAIGSARIILNGRELSEEQKEKYFLE